MARRTHTTHLACIACDELTELGAGKEGWLVDNTNLLTSLDSHSLAIANSTLVLIFDWSEASDDPSGLRVKIRPGLSQIDGNITAMNWLVFDDFRVLAFGTSNGYLMIYSLGGDLIHKQVCSLWCLLLAIVII